MTRHTEVPVLDISKDGMSCAPEAAALAVSYVLASLLSIWWKDKLWPDA